MGNLKKEKNSFVKKELPVKIFRLRLSGIGIKILGVESGLVKNGLLVKIIRLQLSGK